MAQRSALEGVLKAWFAKLRGPVARALSEKFGKAADDIPIGDWAELVPDVEKILITMAADGAAAGLSQIRETETDITDQAHADAVAWAHDRAAELVGMKYDDEGNLVANPDADWAITETTREQLRADVERAVEEGLSTDDFAAELEDAYAFSPERAEMIARTEIAAADVQGSLIGYADSGEVVGKEWLLGSEHAEADECDDAEAMGVVALDDDFGGIGDPPAHPNCICDVIPVLAADE